MTPGSHKATDVEPGSGALYQPLERFLEGRPASAGFVIRFLGSACTRLREIHAAGLSHPDLSPKSILANAVGCVEIQGRPAPPAQATVLISQPKYAAPEQLFGQAGPDDPAHVGADIYVLGFMAYEMLAPPAEFQQQFQNMVRGDLGWMNWHADPGQRLRPLTEFAPECPERLWQLLQRMTDKDAARRIRRLEEIEEVLIPLGRQFETTESLSPRAPAVPAPRPKVRRRFGRKIALAAGILATGVAAWWLWSSGTFANLQPKIAGWSAAIAARLPGRGSARPQAAAIETAAGQMMLVPGGEFTMGNDSVPNQAPAHRVTLPAFYMDRFEVTNALYKKFCDRAQRPYPPAPAWDPAYFSKPGHPALNIPWSEARDFCAAAGKRLPSEAEWEMAARGGSVSSAQWANWVVPGLANLKGSGPGMPAAAGAFAFDVSPNGVQDLAGNVHEWVADDYRLYDGNQNALTGAEAGHKTVRGGSFALRPSDLSPTWRASLAPDLVAGQDLPVGFRCAADAGAAEATLGRPNR